tara:strand:+ start:3071 stop:3259 length:189 start_codon:yes stop_codon:yes gene_type:complete
MEKPLTKTEIIGELLAESQISAEEAITLLQPEPQTVIYNIQVPSEEVVSYPGYGSWSTNITD